MPSRPRAVQSASPPPAVPRATVLLFAFSSFLGAFLLFQVQLIVGKRILPWFGGSAAVWTTSLLMFQLLLLAGYLYAHLVSAGLPARAQACLHGALLGLSLFLVLVLSRLWPSAIIPGDWWRPQGESHPAWHVARLVLVSAGFPFFLLSTTAPLLQRWFALIGSGTGAYRLYALSNLGSLLGLLTFPIVVEPALRLDSQGFLWSALFCLFIAACALCSWQFSRTPAHPSPDTNGSQESGLRLRMSTAGLWFLLAACPSSLMLATTNLLCQEVVTVPLLWVAPLSLYLLSFIFCFDHPRWYRRALFHPLFAAALLLACASLIYDRFLAQLIAVPVLLFLACMVCHGELVRLRPGVVFLTKFYLAISAGGAAGGVFVALLAPRLFTSFLEFQLSLVLALVLFLAVLIRDPDSWLHRSLLLQVLAAPLAVSALAALYLSTQPKPGTLLAASRNFYGVARVYRHTRSRELVHGRTSHGTQFDPPFERYPTSYYGAQSGVGVALREHPRRKSGDGTLRIGAVGLGVGTIAAFGRRGDSIRFYELDPAVAALSQGEAPLFTYLRDSAASISLVLGDARLSLQREAAAGAHHRFDVLVLDAFSGDSVPVHLLTRQAFDLYWDQLDPQSGLIAVHLTSRHVDLAPVLQGAAAYSHAAYRIAWNSPQGAVLASGWFLIARNPALLQLPGLQPITVQYHGVGPRLWTDDYSDIFRLIY